MSISIGWQGVNYYRRARKKNVEEISDLVFLYQTEVEKKIIFLSLFFGKEKVNMTLRSEKWIKIGISFLLKNFFSFFVEEVNLSNSVLKLEVVQTGYLVMSKSFKSSLTQWKKVKKKFIKNYYLRNKFRKKTVCGFV